jgi:hypothetical protein
MKVAIRSFTAAKSSEWQIAAGELVDAAGARQRQHQRAGDEVIAPEDVRLAAIGQRLA